MGIKLSKILQSLDQTIETSGRSIQCLHVASHNRNLTALQSEGAAQHLSELASALTNIEADRSRLLNQITELNTQLRRLADQIENDNSIQKKLPVIEAQLQSLSEEARNHYSSQVDIIKTETRALGTSIKKTKTQQSSNKNIKLRAD